jgi:hypothetical protein
MDWKSKLVVDHCDEISLDNPVFKVSQAGRERVRKEKRKNVHAGVLGCRTLSPDSHSNLTRRVTYNPYTHDTFVVEEEQTAVKDSCSVYMNKGKVFI